MIVKDAESEPREGPGGFWPALRPWLPLIIGAAIALAYLSWARVHVLPLLDHAAFGSQTSFQIGDKIDRAQCSDATNSQECIDSWRARGKPPVILWFGNSQLAGINRYRPGDLPAPELVRTAIAPSGYRVVSYAIDNANLSEQSVTFDAIAPVYRPKLLILPVCYDDIRELQVRETIAAFRPEAATAESPKPEGEAARSSDPGRVATSATVQARFENAASAWLGARWALWAERYKLRAALGFATHILRNKALGIHSTTKRPVDPGVYRERMDLLEKMTRQARDRGMDVLLYVPPYRWDIDGPYVLDDYRRFKTDMKAIADRTGARFADLDSIVPGPEWATVVDDLFGFKEPDFMHFTEAGHRKLADAITREIRAMGY